MQYLYWAIHFSSLIFPLPSSLHHPFIIPFYRSCPQPKLHYTSPITISARKCNATSVIKAHPPIPNPRFGFPRLQQLARMRMPSSDSSIGSTSPSRLSQGLPSRIATQREPSPLSPPTSSKGGQTDPAYIPFPTIFKPPLAFSAPKPHPHTPREPGNCLRSLSPSYTISQPLILCIPYLIPPSFREYAVRKDGR